MKKHLLIGAAFAICLFPTMPLSAQEASTPTIEKPANAPAPVIIPDIVIVPAATIPLPSMQKIVKEAALKRDWIPRVLSDNTIRCDLNVRGKHRVVIDVILANDKITFRYVSSENMNYDPVKKKIHRKYEAWVKILGQDINRSIAQTDMK